MDDALARECLSFQQIDPWTDYWKLTQTLVKAITMLETVMKG